MPEYPFLTSIGCQHRASDCRLLAREATLLHLALQLSRLADMWEALAIEIELYSPSIQTSRSWLRGP